LFIFNPFDFIQLRSDYKGSIYVGWVKKTGVQVRARNRAAERRKYHHLFIPIIFIRMIASRIYSIAPSHACPTPRSIRKLSAVPGMEMIISREYSHDPATVSTEAPEGGRRNYHGSNFL